MALDTQVILDGLGHGVLIFDDRGRLIQHNRAAGTILGTDLNLIREQGWDAAVGLFDAGLEDDDARANNVRTEALRSDQPVRFRILRSGLYIPCSAAAITSDDGALCTLITIDKPDWTYISDVVERFRNEMHDTVTSTLGHVNLINRTLELVAKEDDGASARIGRRINGFTRLIAIHMDRAARMMHLLDRLEMIRTGKMRDFARKERKPIVLEDFIEDFIESLDEIELLDPESEKHDYRSRIEIDVPAGLAVYATHRYLTYTLLELTRNAIMYSLRGTPVRFVATDKGRNVQFEVIDQGYGIRETQFDVVFKPFVRARQPQIISEFGYGLCLHLCKSEVEAMNGRMWFSSQEGVGTTIRFMLPAHRATSPAPD